MQPWLHLTTLDGLQIVINSAHVLCFYVDPIKGETRVYPDMRGSPDAWVVSETVAEIERQLGIGATVKP
jgi:hypothetical protein